YEYTPGRTFREALRAGELDDATAIAAAVQMLEGLAHAHARGIVHRDVKPSNVLMADGERISVRLLDFGLARLPQAETLTAAGDVPGTLAYISPERLGGEPATPAADVWAVGVLLWEALAGRHPVGSPAWLRSPARSRSFGREGGSRSRSPFRSCRSATSLSAPHWSTPRLRLCCWRCSGESHPVGSCSRSARCLRPSSCWDSFPC